MTTLALGATCLAALLHAAPAHAQSSDNPGSNAIRVFATGALGWPPIPSEHNLASQLAVSINRGSQDLTFRLAESTHLEIMGSDVEGAGETALLYGVRSRSAASWIRASGGIGLVRLGYDCDQLLLCSLYGYPTETSTHWGFAWQADAVWTPLASLGLGAALLGNVNSGQSFAALAVSVHVGQVR